MAATIESKTAREGLPAHWEMKPIGEVADLNPPLPAKGEIPDDLAVQFLPMKLVEEMTGRIDLSETQSYGSLQKKSYTAFTDGDVIFAKVTPCMENGKAAVVTDLKNGIGFGSSEFHVLRSKDGVLNRYLFHFIIQRTFRSAAEHAMTGAVGLRRVPKQFMESYPIPLPPLAEQQAIVAKIEELLSELEKGKQQLGLALQQLKVYRQAVLKWAFEGKLTEEWRNARGGAEGAGELPEGWKWVKLGDVCEKIVDGEHFRPPTIDDGIPFLSAKDVRENGVSFGDPLFVSEQTAKKALSRCNPTRGDVLVVSRGATIGRTCAVNSDRQFCLLGSVILIKPSPVLISATLTYLLRSPLIAKGLRGVSGSTAQQAIYLRDIKALEIPLPPLDEQQQIVEEIESRLSVCDKLEETIAGSLAQTEVLRQSILKRAFEGRLV